MENGHVTGPSEQPPPPPVFKGAIHIGYTADGNMNTQVEGSLTDGEMIMLLEMAKLRIFEGMAQRGMRKPQIQGPPVNIDPRALRRGL